MCRAEAALEPKALKGVEGGAGASALEAPSAPRPPASLGATPEGRVRPPSGGVRTTLGVPLPRLPLP